nr:hypothetical protein Iba_chr09cCG13180 [Ipomoea batatas]
MRKSKSSKPCQHEDETPKEHLLLVPTLKQILSLAQFSDLPTYLDFNLTSNPKLKVHVQVGSSISVFANSPQLLSDKARAMRNSYDVDDDEKQANNEDIATRKPTEFEQRAAAMESD